MRAPRPQPIPRCGACDGTNPGFVCEQCHEPTCGVHLVRTYDCVTETRRYICVPCYEEAREAQVLPASVLLIGLPSPVSLAVTP